MFAAAETVKRRRPYVIVGPDGKDYTAVYTQQPDGSFRITGCSLRCFHFAEHLSACPSRDGLINRAAGKASSSALIGPSSLTHQFAHRQVRKPTRVRPVSIVCQDPPP